MLLPLSTNTRENRLVSVWEVKVGSRTSTYELGFGITAGWSARLHVIDFSYQCMNWGTGGTVVFTSRRCCRWLCLSSPVLVKTT